MKLKLSNRNKNFLEIIALILMTITNKLIGQTITYFALYVNFKNRSSKDYILGNIVLSKLLRAVVFVA